MRLSAFIFCSKLISGCKGQIPLPRVPAYTMSALLQGPASTLCFLHQRKSVYYRSVMGPGLCHPCSGTQMGLPSFGALAVPEAEGTWESVDWLFKLPPESDTHPSTSHVIGQSMSHGHRNTELQGSTSPPVPGGHLEMVGHQHRPCHRFSQLTHGADRHASCPAGCAASSGSRHQP